LYLNISVYATSDVEEDFCGISQKSSPRRRVSKRRGQLTDGTSMSVVITFVCVLFEFWLTALLRNYVPGFIQHFACSARLLCTIFSTGDASNTREVYTQ